MSNATNNQQANPGKRAPPPAFDPERPLLVQPWREFVGRGFVGIEYSSEALTSTVKVKLSAQLLTQEEKEAGHVVYVGPQEAKDRIVKLGLWAPQGKKGKKTKSDVAVVELPKRSICKKDFEGSDESLLARARSVAMTIGERTASGRIGSMELTREGKSTFSEWWNGAGSERKARLLSDKKHFDSLTAAEKKRLNSVLSDCPFRGDEPVPTKETQKAGAEPGASSAAKEKEGPSKKDGNGKADQGSSKKTKVVPSGSA